VFRNMLDEVFNRDKAFFDFLEPGQASGSTQFRNLKVPVTRRCYKIFARQNSKERRNMVYVLLLYTRI
jgi:hypothetical protein